MAGIDLARWPHPSPLWGEFWSWCIKLSPLMVLAVIVEGIIDHIRKDDR